MRYVSRRSSWQKRSLLLLFYKWRTTRNVMLRCRLPTRLRSMSFLSVACSHRGSDCAHASRPCISASSLRYSLYRTRKGNVICNLPSRDVNIRSFSAPHGVAQERDRLIHQRNIRKRMAKLFGQGWWCVGNGVQPTRETTCYNCYCTMTFLNHS